MIMSKSKFIEYTSNRKPTRLKDVLIYPNNNNLVVFNPFTSTIFNTLWTSQNEYESALVSFLTSALSVNLPYNITTEVNPLWEKIYSDYSRRYIFDIYFEYIVGWDNTSEEWESIHEHLENDIIKAIVENRYKWGNLLKSCLLDFNPLWNVDGVTGEIREITHTGTDTTSRDGFDTFTKTGTDTNVKSGNHELEYLGTKYNEKAGKEKTSNTGTDTTTNSKTTFESTTFYDTDKSELENGKETTLEYLGATNNEKYQDIERFTNRKDKTTFNDVTDELTHDTEDTTTFNSSIEKLLDLHDKDLFMQIRQGNIGVTTTTSLLNEFRDFVNFNVLNIVAKDIVSSITRGVY